MTSDGSSMPTQTAPPHHQAAALLRRAVLRRNGSCGATAQEPSSESWWLTEPTAAVHMIARQFDVAQPSTATAFGGPWPIVWIGHHLLAPGLPVAAGPDDESGPDGTYRAEHQRVVREAAGRRCCILCADDADRGAPPGSPFDLLWFGEQERYLLRGPTLEVDDLFSTTAVAASSRLLDRLLVRGLRVHAEAVAGLPTASVACAATMSVSRSLELIDPDRWRDPQRLMAAKEEVRRAWMSGEYLLAETEVGELRYRLADTADGWRLELVEGDHPVNGVRMAVVDEHLEYRITLAERVDPLQPGLRGRLAFDLNSDLVMLG